MSCSSTALVQQFDHWTFRETSTPAGRAVLVMLAQEQDPTVPFRFQVPAGASAETNTGDSLRTEKGQTSAWPFRTSCRHASTSVVIGGEKL